MKSVSPVQAKRPKAPAVQQPEDRIKTAIRDTLSQVPKGEELLALYWSWGGSSHAKGEASPFPNYELGYEDSKNKVEDENFNFANGLRSQLMEALPQDLRDLLTPILDACKDKKLDYGQTRAAVQSVLEARLSYEDKLDQDTVKRLKDEDKKRSFLLAFPVALDLPNKINPAEQSLEKAAGKTFDKYLKSFKARSPGQKELYNEHKQELGRMAAGMEIYSRLPAEKALDVAMNRDPENILMKRPYLDKSEKMLGCPGSLAAQDNEAGKEARQPGNQVCIGMRTAVKVGKAVVRPLILSVPAPALDVSPQRARDLGVRPQPEWDVYVGQDGKLNQDAYRKSMQSIADHILSCAQAHPRHRVVLSGFGMNNFLKGLDPKQEGIAKQIGQEVMAKLIRELREQKTDCAYMAGKENDSPWDALASKDKPAYLGRFPGKKDTTTWLSNSDIIVNAWDPHSLVGNGCEHDDSLDGFIGRMTLVHEAHALACAIHNNLMKSLRQGGGARAAAGSAQAAPVAADNASNSSNSSKTGKVKQPAQFGFPDKGTQGLSLGAYLMTAMRELITAPVGSTTATRKATTTVTTTTSTVTTTTVGATAGMTVGPDQYA